MTVFEKETLFVVVIAVLVSIVGGLVAAKAQRERERFEAEIRNKVLGVEPVSAQYFLDNWRVGGRNSNLGFAALDRSGCYVIFTNPVKTEDGQTVYEGVYVGQSIHMCSRVRQHLTGHGNGDVYADVRLGKNVQVHMVPCEEAQMNDLERQLIEVFHATNSYNHTRGGAKRRA